MDRVGFSVALLAGYAPRLSGGSDQHGAGGGTERAKGQKHGRRRAGATGDLTFVALVKARLHDGDGFPLNLEFLGDEHGQSGFHTLAALWVLRDDGNRAVSRNAEMEIGGECVGVGRRERGVFRFRSSSGEHESEAETGVGEAGELDKTAAAER